MLPCKLSVAMVIFFCQQNVQKEDDSYKTHIVTTSIKFIIIKAFFFLFFYNLLHSRRAQSVSVLVTCANVKYYCASIPLSGVRCLWLVLTFPKER